MKKTLSSFLTIMCLFLLISQNIQAQHDHDHESHEHHDHDHDHNHHHHKNEIGIAPSIVYIPGEEGIAYGLHLHYIRGIGESKFGIGLGYERLFDDHGHHTVGIIGSYRPIDPVVVSISPGITFEEIDHIDPSLHIELAYEFLIKGIHLGPLLEYSIDEHESHISLGIHFGIGF